MENNIDKELEDLLRETITGLRGRIGSQDANASDFTAAIKLLTAAGTIERIQDALTAGERAKAEASLLHSLPSFDESGVIYSDHRQ